MREGSGGIVRIGCSGWNYTHWRDVVYPRGLPAQAGYAVENARRFRDRLGA